MTMPQAAPETKAADDKTGAADPFAGFNNDFAAMGLGEGNNEPAKADDNNAAGFDFGGDDPGVGSGNDIFGNFGGGANPAPAQSNQPAAQNNLNQFDSYVDPFSDVGGAAPDNNASNSE